MIFPAAMYDALTSTTPNLHFNSEDSKKRVPVTSTIVPPSTGPREGLTELTMIIASYVYSAVELEKSSSLFDIDKLTMPGTCAGAIHSTCLVFTKLALIGALIDPNLQARPFVFRKFKPITLTRVFPVSGPL